MSKIVWEVAGEAWCHVRLAYKSGFCPEGIWDVLEILDMDVALSD